MRPGRPETPSLTRKRPAGDGARGEWASLLSFAQGNIIIKDEKKSWLNKEIKQNEVNWTFLDSPPPKYVGVFFSHSLQNTVRCQKAHVTPTSEGTLGARLHHPCPALLTTALTPLPPALSAQGTSGPEGMGAMPSPPFRSNDQEPSSQVNLTFAWGFVMMRQAHMHWFR